MSAPLRVGQRVRLIGVEPTARSVKLGATGVMLEDSDTDAEMPGVRIDLEHRPPRDEDGLWYIHASNLELLAPDYTGISAIHGATSPEMEADLVADMIRLISATDGLEGDIDWSTLKVTVAEPTKTMYGESRIVQIEVNAR